MSILPRSLKHLPHVEEKLTVILYTYINRHAEPPNITKHENNSAIEPYNNNIRNLLVYSTIQTVQYISNNTTGI